MSELYFKDADGNFSPVSFTSLNMNLRDKMVFIQLSSELNANQLDSLMEILENIKEEQGIKSTEFIVIPSGVKIDISDRRDVFEKREVLIDLGSINNEHTKDMLHKALKRYHYEFVSLPIKLNEGNA